jgi:pantoate kinase
MMIKVLGAFCTATVLFVGAASASVVAHVYEQANGSGGTDIIATYSGSLDLSATMPSFSYGSSVNLNS